VGPTGGDPTVLGLLQTARYSDGLGLWNRPNIQQSPPENTDGFSLRNAVFLTSLEYGQQTKHWSSLLHPRLIKVLSQNLCEIIRKTTEKSWESASGLRLNSRSSQIKVHSITPTPISPVLLAIANILELSVITHIPPILHASANVL